MIEVGSVKVNFDAPKKKGFIAYDIVSGIYTHANRGKPDTETEITYGPLTHIYVPENNKNVFEDTYIAKGEIGTKSFGEYDPFNPDRNRRWSPPKKLFGVLWKIENSWVLVHKTP